MTIRCFTHIAAAIALAAFPALAARPNFTGEWKLNVAKSDFGQMPSPTSASYKITHEDPKLKNAIKQSSEMGDVEFESNYTTDGKESTNQVFGSPVKSTARWDGDVLVINSTGKFGDADFSMNDKWTLSPDGKTLTIMRSFKSAMGEGTQKLIVEKQ
jgi:hypothetical protein